MACAGLRTPANPKLENHHNMTTQAVSRPGVSRAVAQTEAKRDIRTFLMSETVKKQVALALPSHLTPDRMLRVVLTTMMRTPKLALCTQESLLNCVMQCSALGLEPDGRRAHLIPFENRKTGTVECTLIIDWKGLAELALRSGVIAKLHADVICDHDEFDYDMGDILHHKIDWRKDRGEPYAAYAMAVTKTGEKFVAVMQKWEIERIRDNSQGWKAFKQGWAKQSPWQDSPAEMWKKTAFRRLSKWLPLSAEFRDGIDADEVIDATGKPQAPGAALPSMFELPALPETVDEKAEGEQANQPEPEPAPAQAPDEPAPEPPPAKAAPAADRSPTKIKAIRGLLKMAGKTEADLINMLRSEQQIDDSISSLEEIAMVKPILINHIHDKWGTISGSL